MALKSAITIDPFETIISQRTIVLTGTNATAIKTVQLDTKTTGYIIQPTTTTWRAEIKLQRGLNIIKISGIDRSGNTTAEVTAEVTLQKLFDTQHKVFNPLDHFGLVLGLERLPGEKNLPYRSRLLDVKIHPADATITGLTHGAARELGMKVHKALTISSPIDDRLGISRSIDGRIRINGVYLYLASPRFVFKECLTVEPATLSVTLKKPLRGDEFVAISTMNGDRVSTNDWAYELKTNRLLFSNRDLGGKDLSIDYEYVEKIALKDKSLYQLRSDIEALVDTDGRSLFSVTLIEPVWGVAADLIPIPTNLINEEPLTLERCQLRVRELHNKDFNQSKLNTDQHAIGTKLASWVQRINTQTRITWNSVLLDESQWEPLGEEPGLGALPHLADAERGYWRSLKGSETEKFNRKDFRRYKGVSPTTSDKLQYRGIKPLQFQSGTGTQEDLKVLKFVEVN